jgi:peptide/nickel transport system permease protein
MTFRYIVGRLGQAVIVVVLVSMVSFGLSHLGGDPARLLAGPFASRAQVEQLSAALGLDRPVPVQYEKFVGNAVQSGSRCPCSGSLCS